MHTEQPNPPADGATQFLSALDPIPYDLLYLVGRTKTRADIEVLVARFCGDICALTEAQLRAMWEHSQALSHGWARHVAPEEMLGRAEPGTLPLEGALVPGGYQSWGQAVHDRMVDLDPGNGIGGREAPQINAIWTGSSRTCWGATPAGKILEVITRPTMFSGEYAVVAVRLGAVLAAIVSANLAEEVAARVDGDWDEAKVHGDKTTRYLFLNDGLCRIGARAPLPHTRVAWGRHLGADEARVVAALRGAE